MSKIISGLGLVIAAGGASNRFGDGNKLLADLGGMPVFLWSIRELSSVIEKGLLVLSAPAGEIAMFEEAIKWHIPEFNVKVVAGGKSRTDSVLNALKALPDAAKTVAVHDAARPFIKLQTLLDCVAACKQFGGAVAAKKVTDTIKEADADGIVVKTLDRSCLWAMETPQVFDRETLQRACEKAIADGAQITDDAAAVECYSGVKVKLLENPHFNIKITYASDLELARERLPSIAGEANAPSPDKGVVKN